MGTPVMTEEELQASLADPKRRRSAFAQVVRLYSKQVYWQIRRMVYCHEDADDLTQNVFIKAWEAIEGFRGEAKVSSYAKSRSFAYSLVKRQRLATSWSD